MSIVGSTASDCNRISKGRNSALDGNLLRLIRKAISDLLVVYGAQAIRPGREISVPCAKDRKRLLDKFVGGAKIPKISGQACFALCLGAKVLGYRIYDLNPSVSQPREEP